MVGELGPFSHGGPKVAPHPPTLGAVVPLAWRPRGVNGRMALRHGFPSTVPRCRQRTQDAPRAGARRHRAGGVAQPRARRVGARADHADVRAVGLLRRRAALRVLSAGTQGDGSLDPPVAHRSEPGIAGAGRAAAPPLRAARLDRARPRGRRRRAARPALAAPSAHGRSPRRGGGLSMGAVLDLSERFWRGEVRGPELVRASGAVEEIAPDVLFVHAFANVTALRTADGLVLVDTGNYRARDKTFAAVRAWDARPLATAVYTHGHVDHACGLPPFLDEAQRNGWPRPRIVGHRDVARRFDRYRATAPWNGLINARQFSIPPSWPTEYDYPDTTYADTHRLEIGGIALELTHARGETDDHTWLWWAARRILFTGDLFFWVAPNAGNPQKVQRYAAEWAVALRAMAALGREVAGLAGGVGALVARAKALAADGDLSLASHLADWAVAAAPADRAAHAVRAEVYDARAKASAALMTRGIFAAVARESADKAGAG